jgi:hypothetical protein
MPAAKITSQTPWHVIAVADIAENADPETSALVLEALQSLAAELVLLSQGLRPYFLVSLIENASPSGVHVAHGSDADVDEILFQGLAFESERASLAHALREVAGILQAHPGDPTDFTPYVIVVTSGRIVSDQDVAVAQELRELDIAAGAPKILILHFEDAPDPGYERIAGRPDHVFRLSAPDRIGNLIPPVGSSVQDNADLDEVSVHIGQIAGSI